jgi:uncharacterized protein involved in exopolysaccharide biosynthesis
MSWQITLAGAFIAGFAFGAVLALLACARNKQ